MRDASPAAITRAGAAADSPCAPAASALGSWSGSRLRHSQSSAASRLMLGATACIQIRRNSKNPQKLDVAASVLGASQAPIRCGTSPAWHPRWCQAQEPVQRRILADAGTACSRTNIHLESTHELGLGTPSSSSHTAFPLPVRSRCHPKSRPRRQRQPADVGWKAGLHGLQRSILRNYKVIKS